MTQMTDYIHAEEATPGKWYQKWNELHKRFTRFLCIGESSYNRIAFATMNDSIAGIWDAPKDAVVHPLPECTGWDWKPEPKWEPFTSGEEAFEALQTKGFYLRHKQRKDIILITVFTERTILVGDTYRNMDNVFNNFECLDGTPFGKKIV